MKLLSLIIFTILLMVKKETNAQLMTVFKSDTLNIYTNKNGENIKPSICLLKFGEFFNDSVVVYLNNKRVFSKFLKPSTIEKKEADLAAPFISLPLKNKKSELKIILLNEKITVITQVIRGYRYLYVSNIYGAINLYYKNEKEMYY